MIILTKNSTLKSHRCINNSTVSTPACFMKLLKKAMSKSNKPLLMEVEQVVLNKRLATAVLQLFQATSQETWTILIFKLTQHSNKLCISSNSNKLNSRLWYLLLLLYLWIISISSNNNMLRIRVKIIHSSTIWMTRVACLYKINNHRYWIVSTLIEVLLILLLTLSSTVIIQREEA